MTTSRVPVAPINLKERIAALQQRNVSPTPRPTSPSLVPSTALNSAGLRDKIAKFERKGGVPVPRGSFGLGAPPLAENGQEKRRGELYGNRIPGAVRVSGGPPISRSVSPFESPRSFSPSALGGDDNDAQGRPTSPSSPVSPHLGLFIDHTDGKEVTPRSTAFATVLDIAKRIENGGEMNGRRDTPESSPPPVDLSTPVKRTYLEKEVGEEGTQSPIAIVISSDDAYPTDVKGNPFSEPLANDTLQSVPLAGISTDPVASANEEQQVEHPSSSSENIPHKKSLSITRQHMPSGDQPSVQDPIPPTNDSSSTIIPPELDDAVTDAIVDIGLTTPISTSEQVDAMPIDPATKNSVDTSEPYDTPTEALSPIEPFTLASGVHDLGKVVANIQDVFPDQISPIVSPPSYRRFRPPTATSGEHDAHSRTINGENEKAEGKPVIVLSKPVKDSTPVTLSTDEVSLPSSPRTGSSTGRPVSMFETSPSHVTMALRVTPLTNQGVSTFLPANDQVNQKDYERFPPTPEHKETDFGTVAVHKPPHFFSTNTSNNVSTFSAVVHKKVAQQHPLQPSGGATGAFHLAPQTPQTSKTGAPMLGDVPLSPGFGELTDLLQHAALLEQTLEQGEPPTGAASQEEVVKRHEKEQEQLSRVEVPEYEMKGKGKANTERELSDVKSKSRNPMLRSKIWRKDPSGDVQSNPPRSKSALFPFRSQQDANLHQPASIQEEQVTNSTVDIETTSQMSTAMSAKSSRQYFSSLRRLTSGSRPSTSIGTHPRYSLSTSSEMSSEDSASIPTPLGPVEPSSAGEFGSVVWPSVSPRKSPGSMSRAASFADKMWNRGRTKSTRSAVSAYETVDRLTKSAATKSTITLIPPIDPISYTFEVPELSSPPERLVSPRRSASLYVSAPQFSPIHLANPPSPVYAPLPPVLPEDGRESLSLDALFVDGLTNPTYTSAPAGNPQDPRVVGDAFFSAKPTSSVYTRDQPGFRFRLSETPPSIPMRDLAPFALPPLPPPGRDLAGTTPDSPSAVSLLPRSDANQSIRDSWVSADSSMDASIISIISSPLVDSFPSVPHGMPAPTITTPGQRSNTQTNLPLRNGPFFEPSPLSSTTMEFLRDPFVRSATVRPTGAS